MENRLKNLKNALNMGWGELADRLGISRSMLDQTRNGVKIFGPKTMRVLIEAEREAGIYKEEPKELSCVVEENHGEHGSGQDEIMAKLDEILRRLEAVEKKLKNN